MIRFLRKSSAILIASALGVSLAYPAMGASDTSKPATDKSATATKPATTPIAAGQEQRAVPINVRASKLIGKDVRNSKNEDLGDIKDLVLDVNSGRVHYVVLSFGGFLGLGNKLFAYPMRAFRPAVGDELVLDVPQERLKSAPGFEANAYPDWNAPDYRNQVDRHFGRTVTASAESDVRLVRASELIGKDVNGVDGKDLGEIEDVVVNLRNGNVRYAVLEFDQSWSLKDKLFAFPLKSFKGGAKWSDDLVLNVTKDALNKTPGFDKKTWPNVNDPKWTTDIDRYLVATTVPLPSTTNDALWSRLDSNRDGVLTAEEAKADATVQSNWKKIDSNNDGRASRTEFNAGYRR